MNFFRRQEAARRHTRWLAVLFILALVTVLVAVNTVVLLLLAWMNEGMPVGPVEAWRQARPSTLLATSLVVLAVVGLSSLYKSAQLASGGGAVALALGGTRLERGSTDVLRRRLFNVVEEIAIASGVPLPEIYVLEHEAGINAFAAGHTPANAAVAVTRGALEKLSRAELQGVIAHEFGHVLNGDMRLNTRLIGLIFGLLVLALIGRTLLRWGPRRTRRGGSAIVLAAAAVMVLGYIGVFFGRLIQAAISRRRESLADASAVQFTRDPSGLKGALVKIGALSGGSALDAPAVEEVAHMLFAPGLARLFATHPPLIERILALDPHFHEREFAAVRADPGIDPTEVVPPTAMRAQKHGIATLALTPAVAGQVGHFDAEALAQARELIAGLPTEWVEKPGGAEGMLLALALDREAGVRRRQLRSIEECLDESACRRAEALDASLSGLALQRRLPLLQEAIAPLRRLPAARRRALLACMNRLVLADGQIGVFEYALATLARVYLQDELGSAEPARPITFQHATVELQALFSTLAQHGAEGEQDARHAYEIGMHHLLPLRHPAYRPVRGWPGALDRALRCLDRLAPAGKARLVEALVKTISHDRRFTLEEVELLRAVCAALHCPLPISLAHDTSA